MIATVSLASKTVSGSVPFSFRPAALDAAAIRWRFSVGPHYSPGDADHARRRHSILGDATGPHRGTLHERGGTKVRREKYGAGGEVGERGEGRAGRKQ